MTGFEWFVVLLALAVIVGLFAVAFDSVRNPPSPLERARIRAGIFDWYHPKNDVPATLPVGTRTGTDVPDPQKPSVPCPESAARARALHPSSAGPTAPRTKASGKGQRTSGPVRPAHGRPHSGS